jgi:hypothetical protein
MYTNEELEVLTSKWASDRGITTNGKVITQCMKLMEELGEMASHIAKGQPIEDDIGDCVVVLNNIARLSGTTLNICWNVAYEDIKDRKGFLTEDGVFIKESDPNYSKYVNTNQMQMTIVDNTLVTEYFTSADSINHN